MSQQISLIPESAPFNDEQRAWLNGFMAGWLGLQSETSNGHSNAALANNTHGATTLLEAPSDAAANSEDEDYPWHDPAIELSERLQLAEGKPFSRRLMAAMAQLDCGSCGYDCKRYADAIANGEEKSLTLCSPGGKATSKKLKELVASQGRHTSNGTATISQTASLSEKEGTNGAAVGTRNHPFSAKILKIQNLNGEGSAKQTSHVEIDLSAGDLNYDVGDALGVYPSNCPELVQDMIEQLGCSPSESVDIDGRMYPLDVALRDHCCLSEITDEFLELLSRNCHDSGQSQRLQDFLKDSTHIESWDVYELMREFSSVRMSPQDFVNSLSRMKPRLYSISSSLKAYPRQVHLTVGRVHWKLGERTRKGVASTMFSDRLQLGDAVRVFVQKSHGFTVPQDPSTPMIMIGPGTGIAPFRAFLQERRATGAKGKNWLLFGDQRVATDFLYQEELEGYRKSGLLTRFEVAFSRDQSQKIYVQDRMWEHAAEFWQWITEGCTVYVCGDAKRMAVDVDRTLRKIISECGKLNFEQTDSYVKQMVQEKRYCRDVY